MDIKPIEWRYLINRNQRFARPRTYHDINNLYYKQTLEYCAKQTTTAHPKTGILRLSVLSHRQT